MRYVCLLAVFAFLPACGELGIEEPEPLVDTDGDGLFDVFEEEISTDPTLADTDLDGFSDFDEWAAYCDPTDVEDYEYQGGWDHQPYPLDLEGNGYEWGSTVYNFQLPDRLGQQISLYTFYGNVVEIVSEAVS